MPSRLDKTDNGKISESVLRTAYQAVMRLPVPFIYLNSEKNIYICNLALAKSLGYHSVEDVEKLLENGQLIALHFDPAAVSELHAAIRNSGSVHKWLMLAQDIQGKECVFEVNATLIVDEYDKHSNFIEAFVLPPIGDTVNEALTQKIKNEIELASKAKNEFLSNISHELLTPLNVIIGMLNLALENQGLSSDMQDNLSFAKQGADKLFTIVNDLIMLSNLEGHRLVAEIGQFNTDILLKSVKRQYARKAEEKNITIKLELDEYSNIILDGSYNLIILALEKILDNAIKFAGSHSSIIMEAKILESLRGHRLRCMVHDSGPGFEDKILTNQDLLFMQGDGSINRKHGGLGIGLKLITSIVSRLNGTFIIGNLPEGGAECGFELPIQYSAINND